MNTRFEDLIMRGNLAARPTPGIPGRLFYNTTDGLLQRDSGVAWEDCEGAGAVMDADAFHDNVDGEIAALTEKSYLATADLFLIEDSESSFAKKKFPAGALGVATDYSQLSTVVGFSGTPTIKIILYTIGKLVNVMFSLTGTSNSTELTFTLPYYCTSLCGVVSPVYGVNNGAGLSSPARVVILAGENTVRFDKLLNAGAGGWTASGTKTVQGFFSFMID